MVDDLTEKAQASTNKLEALIDKIPGVGAYRQKEKRRDADKLLRLHVAGELDNMLNQLGSVQYTLTMQGRLDVTLVLERAATKLQLLIDRLKTAPYGYTGFFDAVKVDEEALDRLYRFDESLLEKVDELSTALDGLVQAVDSGEAVMPLANALVRQLEALNATYSQRQDVLLA